MPLEDTPKSIFEVIKSLKEPFQRDETNTVNDVDNSRTMFLYILIWFTALFVSALPLTVTFLRTSMEDISWKILFRQTELLYVGVTLTFTTFSELVLSKKQDPKLPIYLILNLVLILIGSTFYICMRNELEMPIVNEYLHYFILTWFLLVCLFNMLSYYSITTKNAVQRG